MSMVARSHDLVGGEGWGRTRSGLYLPPHMVPERRPTAIDLFAGCGGFSLGFHQAGWDVVAAVEWDVAAASTYLHNLGGPTTELHFDEDREQAWQRFQKAENGRRGRGGSTGRPAPDPGGGWISGAPAVHPVQHLYVRDVRKLTGAEILNALGMEVGQVNAIIGGPPCQGFSNAGRRDVMDPRNSMVFDFCRLVLEIRPHTFVMENVPGIISMVTPEGIPVIDAMCSMLADGDYGSYDALRRALTSHPSARAAARGKASTGQADEDDDLDRQQELFG